MIKSTIYKSVDSHIGKFIGRMFPGIHPNWITLAGVTASVLAAAFFYMGKLQVGLVLLILSGLLDILDGIVARATGKTSKFGSFLDSATDRFSDMAVLIGLLLHYFSAGAPAELFLTCGLFPAFAMIPYLKAKAESYGFPCNVGIAERGERIAVLSLGLLTGQMVFFLALLNLLCYFTVGQRMVYAYRNIR